MSTAEPKDPQGTDCFRLRAAAEPDPGVSQALAGHAQDCGPCGQWLSRRRRMGELLGGLTRAKAPAGLEELVRSDIGRAPVEAVLGALLRRPAPPVLDRLVHEEVLDPERAALRRHLGGLPRLVAPSVPARSFGPRNEHRPWRRIAGLSPLAAAVALVALLFLPQSQDPTLPQSNWRPRYQVVEVEHPEALNPMARSLAEGLVGAPLLPANLPTRR